MEFTDCTPEQLYVVCKSLRYIVENDSKLADKVLDVTKILFQTDKGCSDTVNLALDSIA